MNAGELDRRILIEQATLTPDAYGQPVETWSQYQTVWAKVQPVNAQERFTADARREAKLTVFTIRYLPSVTVEMRVIFETKIYRIIGVSEVGRRVGTEILGEVID